MNLIWMIRWTARWSLPYCKSHESHLKAESNWFDARLDKPQNGACCIADSPYWNGWDSCIIDGERMRLSRMSSSRRLKLIASTKDVKWSHPKHYPVWKPTWIGENELTDFPSCTISCWIRSWTPGTLRHKMKSTGASSIWASSCWSKSPIGWGMMNRQLVATKQGSQLDDGWFESPAYTQVIN